MEITRLKGYVGFRCAGSAGFGVRRAMASGQQAEHE